MPVMHSAALALVPALLTTVWHASASEQDERDVGRPYMRVVPDGLDLYMPIPEDNALTSEKVALGRRLFFDRQLSRDQSMSCATCHDPRRAFTDGRAVARGIDRQRGERNVPTIINRGYGTTFSWDGRLGTLEEQVLAPVSSPRELGSDPAVVVARLSRDGSYRHAFGAAFGGGVTEQVLSRALASFVRTVRSADSAVDRFANRTRAALSPEAQLGLRVFLGKGNCWLCHAGPTFSDDKFHNTGIAWDGQRFRDPGRARVTGLAPDRGAFKTPTLRDVARTAPYMHDGSLRRLEDVVEFYARGGRPNPHLDEVVARLSLTLQEKRGLVAFLRALTGRTTY